MLSLLDSFLNGPGDTRNNARGGQNGFRVMGDLSGYELVGDSIRFFEPGTRAVRWSN